MKIFRVNRRVGEWPREAEEALRTPYGAPLRALDVNVLADSAANRNNRPMFVPDFAREGWVVEVLPAVRIGRLGKFIAPRFAHRYIQDILLTAFLHQPDGDPVAPLAPLGGSFFFCRRVVMRGQGRPVPAGGGIRGLRLR